MFTRQVIGCGSQKVVQRLAFGSTRFVSFSNTHLSSAQALMIKKELAKYRKKFGMAVANLLPKQLFQMNIKMKVQ